MKQIISFTCLLLSAFAQAQNLDSLLAEPQVVELKISTPQPRLKETFQISMDVNHLRANIFRSLAGKVELSNDISTTDNSELTMNVNAIQKGKNEIGPLVFFVDKTRYTTNKITFDVIDPLPDIDKGVWFRKVMTSDSTFCIIIEQRIPAKSVSTNKTESSIMLTTEPEYSDIVKFKGSYSIDGVSGSNALSTTNFGRVDINGEEKQFMYGFSVYYFNIKDKKAKIKITKERFENIPDDHKFENIIIQ